MRVQLERFSDHAPGQPFHAALVEMRGAYRPHGHHDYFEMMAVIEGEGQQKVSTNGGPSIVQPLRPGDVMLMRPLDVHALSGDGTPGMRFFNIAFPSAAWHAFADLADLDPSWSTASTPPQARFDPADDRVLDIFHAVIDRFRNAPTTMDLLRFWTESVSLLAPPADDADRPPGAPGWLLAGYAAMRQEEYLREGVPRLLELAHVSPAHLARTVRRYFGTTPTDLIADLRLRHAAMLIATTARSITEIAYRCGFSSPSYFTRCFRRAYHLSPREYRHRAQHAFVP